jgi:hypothetical protein
LWRTKPTTFSALGSRYLRKNAGASGHRPAKRDP